MTKDNLIFYDRTAPKYMFDAAMLLGHGAMALLITRTI